MPYTTRSLAFTWLIILALCAVSVSGSFQGRWFVLLVAVALATPALVLKDAASATGAFASLQRNRTAAVAAGSQRHERRWTARAHVVPSGRHAEGLKA